MNKIHVPELDNLFDWDKRFDVNPKDVKWALTTNSWFDPCKNEWNKVYDGDWDKRLEIEKDFVYSSVKDMFKHNVPFKETELYKTSVQQILNGMVRWGCRTPEEFAYRESLLRTTYALLKSNGFQTQDELEANGFVTIKLYGKNIDDPGVIMDRDGRYLYHNANHRLPMFQILNINPIKIKVNARHKEWAEFIKFVKKINKSVWGDENKTYQPINHIDFQDVQSEWSDYRTVLIQSELIGKAGFTLLDIGALFGGFSSYLEEYGLNCTAVEMNKDFVTIMTKLRDSQDKKFNIIHDSIFNLKETKFDIVLALNIFHHFLKSQTTYEQLITFLNRLECKEMYFQPHLTNESQMDGAFKNFDNNEFIKFIIDNSCLRYNKMIGCENGRNIYKLWRD